MSNYRKRPDQKKRKISSLLQNSSNSSNDKKLRTENSLQPKRKRRRRNKDKEGSRKIREEEKIEEEKKHERDNNRLKLERKSDQNLRRSTRTQNKHHIKQHMHIHGMMFDLTNDEDDAIQRNIEKHYGEYIENTDREIQPHHINSRMYVQNRTDKPPKNVVCYWVFPAQHGHRQVIMQIEMKDYNKVLIENEYLNDTIIDFQLKYTYSSWESSFKNRVYVFNSFFWNKLLELGKKSITSDDKNQLLKWTKNNQSLFEKDYIIIPKCSHRHWELVIICYAGKVLKQYTEQQNDDDDIRDIEDGGIEHDDEEEEQKENEEEQKKRPCIIILDSLHGDASSIGSKTTECKLIRKWLNLQAQDYLHQNGARNDEDEDEDEDEMEEIFYPQSMKSYSIKVPLQPNDHDCGCFLLRNALAFGNDYGFADTSNEKALDRSKWYDAHDDGVGYRQEISNTLQTLMKEQKQYVV